MKLKNEFKSKDLELAVLYPTTEQQKEGQAVYNRAFAFAVSNKALLRPALDKVLIEQGIWDDNKANEFSKIDKEITETENKLRKGKMKLSAGKELAIELIRLRAKQTNMLAERREMDNVTAEAQADNARFDYFVSVCTVYKDTGKKFFKDLDDYLTRGSEEYSQDAARNLMALMYGVDADFKSKLPESQFLKKYGFVDDQYRFINKSGQLTDDEGRLVNEDGRFIDSNGNFVDRNGNPVTEDGESQEEQGEFYDDATGKPIV